MKEEPKIENIKKMTRPPKYDETMTHFTIRLRSDQMEFLSEKENIGEWIREAIDKAILEETENIDTTASNLTILKRIEILKKELRKYVNSEFYEEAPENLETMKHFFKQAQAKDEDIIFKKGFKIEPDGTTWLHQSPYWIWRKTTIPVNFVIQHNLKFNEELPLEKLPLLVKELKAHYKFTQKKFEAYKQKIKELKEEIKNLEKRLCAT